jgi:hypothetical protein
MLLLTQAASTAMADSDAAFEAFKSLKGRWAIQSGGKAITTVMTYDVGSKDSIVTEQFGKELTVIYRDGARSPDDSFLQCRQSTSSKTQTKPISGIV